MLHVYIHCMHMYFRLPGIYFLDGFLFSNTPLAKRNGQFSIYLPFLIHFSLIFHLLTIYFHFFWSQLSQTIYWNHLLAIHTEKCFKMAISFHWFIIYLKNGIETELPLLSSPFSFHFFSRPFFPLKWLFEEAWSTV